MAEEFPAQRTQQDATHTGHRIWLPPFNNLIIIIIIVIIIIIIIYVKPLGHLNIKNTAKGLTLPLYMYERKREQMQKTISLRSQNVKGYT